MKTTYKMICMVILGVLIITACAPAATPAATNAPVAAQPTVVPTAKPLRVAALFAGTIDDAGWVAAAYDGLVKAKEKYGIEFAYSEKLQPADYESTFRDYANQGYDIIIGHGDPFGDAALKVAKDYPNIVFAVTNAPLSATNVQGLDTKNTEAGYVAGIIAGTLTKTKKVGYISVIEILSMVRGEIGFRDGVKEVCPDCEVDVTYTGDFTDIGLGKEAELALIAKGVDITFLYADAPGMGAIQAAKENGHVMVIASGQDQSSLAPDQVVTTVIQDLAPLIVNLVGEVKDGTFKPNTIAEHGFDTGIYYLAPLNPKLVTPEQSTLILSYVQKLKDHTLVLPVINQIPPKQ
jgi:basic membrane protein A